MLKGYNFIIHQTNHKRKNTKVDLSLIAISSSKSKVVRAKIISYSSMQDRKREKYYELTDKLQFTDTYISNYYECRYINTYMYSK